MADDVVGQRIAELKNSVATAVAKSWNGYPLISSLWLKHIPTFFSMGQKHIEESHRRNGRVRVVFPVPYP